MSKTITSPVAKFPGTVDLPDFYTWDDLIAWDEAIDAADDEPSDLKVGKIYGVLLPRFVEAFHIEGLPEHPAILPPNPVKPARAFLIWIRGEVSKVIHGDEAVDIPLSVESGAG